MSELRNHARKLTPNSATSTRTGQGLSSPVEDCEGCPALAGIRNVGLDTPSARRPDSLCNFGGVGPRRRSRIHHRDHLRRHGKGNAAIATLSARRLASRPFSSDLTQDEMQADDHCRHRGHPRHSGPVNPVRTRVQRETPTSGSEAVCSGPTPIRSTEAQRRTSVRAARWCCGRYRQLTPTNPNDLWRGRPASRQPPPSHTGDESPTNLRGTL